MEHLHLNRILGIPDMPLNPHEEGLNLSQVVLGFNVLFQQDVDGLLANIEIFRARSNQRLHMLNRLLCSTPPLRNMTDNNLRRSKRRRLVSWPH